MRKLTLVLGGARSGKSRFAEGLGQRAAHKTYIATAEAMDAEMRERIARHRTSRGGGWATLEAPLDLVGALGEAGHGFVLVDCLTVWLGNLMHHGRDIKAEVDGFCAALADVGHEVVLVSNEVGLSIVPENAMARQFRDEQGLMNQRIAGLADEVYLVAAGLPLALKR